MNTNPRKAISYVRFSTPKQQHGFSLSRQIDSTREFCKRHNLILDQSLTIKDLGVSGFHGKNISDGNLGLFLDGVRSKKIPSGVVLCIENLDRLTRDDIVSAMTLFLSILNLGIDIGLVNDDKILTKEYVKNNPYELIIDITYLIRGNNESQTKSIRVKDSVIRRIEQVKQGIPVSLGKFAPSWVKYDKLENKYNLIPDKVKPIKEIFRLYLKGHHSPTITKLLNQSGKYTKKFSANSIRSLLRNKQTIGTVTLHHVEYPNYIPSVIDKSDFDKVQLMLDKNKTKHGHHSNNVNNLFNGLIYCEKCRGVLCVNGKKDYLYYKCLTHRENLCEEKHYLRTNKVERWIFTVLLKQLPQTIIDQQNTTTQKDITTKEKELKDISRKRSIIVDLIDDPNTVSDDIKPRLIQLNEQETTVKKEIEHLKMKQSQILTRPDNITQFLKLLKRNLKDQETRREIKSILPSFIQRIFVNLSDEHITIELVDGSFLGSNDLTDDEVNTDTFETVFNHSKTP